MRIKALSCISFFLIILFYLNACSNDNIKSTLDKQAYTTMDLSGYTIPENNGGFIPTTTRNIQYVFNKTMSANAIPAENVKIYLDNTEFPGLISDIVWTTKNIPNDTIKIDLFLNRLPENTTFVWEIKENSLVDLYGTPILHDRITGKFTTGLGRTLTFTDNGDGTVTDSKTGLIWKKCAEGLSGSDCSSGTPSELLRADAVTACTSLDTQNSGNGFGGQTTWRLPSIEEIITIINYSAKKPASFASFFPNTPFFTTNYSFWSSSNDAEDPRYELHITSNYGYTWYYFFSSSITEFTRCVAGPPITKFNLTDESNGTVKDATTGLSWQKCNIGQTWDSLSNTCTGTAETVTWFDALSRCKALDLAGKSDWRLPTMDELNSIVDYVTWDPAVKNAMSPLFEAAPVIPDVNEDKITWTSTTVIDETHRAWEIQFRNGYTGFGAFGTTKLDPDNFARCVAGP